MRNDLEDSFEADILKPAKDLRLNNNEEEEYERGLIVEKCPEILVRGHSAFSTSLRVEKMASGAKILKYIFMPTKFSLRKVIQVTVTILKNMKSLNPMMQTEEKHRLKMYIAKKETSDQETQVGAEESFFDFFVKNDQFMGICWGSEKPLSNIKGDAQIDFKDEDIAEALEYWYKKGTAEVKEFNKN